MAGISIASFNLHWGRRARSTATYDVVDACRQLDVDVLALQEVWRADGEASIAEAVAAELGYELRQVWTGRGIVDPRCKAVGRHGDTGGTGDWGQALLTRVPRGPVTEHRLAGFLFDPVSRAVLTAPVDVGAGAITVVAAHFPHLEHFSPLLRWRLRDVLPRPDEPAVLLGDFNLWRWTARLIVPGWTETVRGSTWPARRPTFQIDHLLVTDPVVATDCEVVPVGGSDHLPIRARLSLKNMHGA